MGDAIGQMLPSAVGVALSPFPIIAVVLMLVTPRGRVNGPVFILGWLVGLAIVGAIMLSVAKGADASEGVRPRRGSRCLELVLGVLLLLVAVKQFRGRPHEGEEAPTPKWMGALDTFTPVKAVGRRHRVLGAEPEEPPPHNRGRDGNRPDRHLGGRADRRLRDLHADRDGRRRGARRHLLRDGDRSRDLLENLKNWMAHNNAVIMAVIMLIIGFKLIGQAISGLSN